MTTLNKRTTIYLDPELHKALRLKAAANSKSVTELINDAVRESLAEDDEDNAAILVREKEPTISYDEMVRRLKKDGLLKIVFVCLCRRELHLSWRNIEIFTLL